MHLCLYRSVSFAIRTHRKVQFVISIEDRSYY